MNYLIFDTEKTYNYGFIVVDDKGTIQYETNLVITNNFENRNLVGENTYKRKMPIYSKDPHARFVIAADGANFINTIFNQYHIDQIISHNVSEDRRQLELLSQQTGVVFPAIPFYDSINLVKVLFPSNTQTGLEAIVSDVTGIDVKQTHTALQDCHLLLNLIRPILEYIPYFIKYQEIFAHDSDYEITQKFFANFNKIIPLPKNIKDITTILGMDDSPGNKKTASNFIKRMADPYKFWEVNECIEYSEKTGKPLKTPGLMIQNGENFNDAVVISVLFASLDKISESIVSACVAHQASQETDEMILARLEAYKTSMEAAYNEKQKILEAEYKDKEHILSEREKNFNNYCENQTAELKRREWECGQAQAAIPHNVACMLMNKVAPLVDGGLFNAEAKRVKEMIRNNDLQGLYNYFMR